MQNTFSPDCVPTNIIRPIENVLTRIAWIGGGVGQAGGVGEVGLLLLNGLLKLGITVDMFAIGEDCNVPIHLREQPELSTIPIPLFWQWDRWYSRGRLRPFVSGLFARVRAYRRMINELRQRHAARPYDVIFQMSQTELFNLKKHLHELPPVVVFPCVHAAGELRWHRRESAYARKSENFFVHYLVRFYLIIRTAFQKRELQKPAMIIGMSNRFNDLLRQDYGVDPSRQAVIYNPISPPPADSVRVSEARDSGRPLRLLYIARISVRKGVEAIVELSHRLKDLQGQVELQIIGGPTMWSDYRGHLKDLNPSIASYLGPMPHDQIMRAYDQADALLLPSHYEPGGIVVGEALSRGVPVVVSDEIGSAEPIDGPCCRRFRAGDMDGFEHEVRSMIIDLNCDPSRLRASAQQQAAEHFMPSLIAEKFISILNEVSRRPRSICV